MAAGSGLILFGYCLDITLYGILTVQTYLYYLAFPQDRTITKSIVYFVYILETLQTAFALHDFYTLFCTLQGHRDLESPVFGLHTSNFMWFTVPASGTLVAFVVELFYAHRIYVISKAKVVTTIVSVLALLQLIFGIIAVALNLTRLRFGNNSVTILGAVNLLFGPAFGAGCDLLITIYMSCYLSKQTQGIPRATQVLVTKVARLLLETGMVTAGMAVIYIILDFLTIYGLLIPGLSLGKLYANSMLVVLNNRFTIPGGRNAPHPDFDIPSYRHSNSVGANTDPVVSPITSARSRPADTTLSNGEVHTTGSNPRRG